MADSAGLFVQIVNGHRLWVKNPYASGWSESDLDQPELALPSAGMWDPRLVLPAFALDFLEEKQFAGRAAQVVRAVPFLSRDPDMPLLWPGASEYELAIDIDRGVILSWVAKLGDITFGEIEVSEIDFDLSFEESLFMPG